MRATATLLTVSCLSLMASAASAAPHPLTSARWLASALLGQLRAPSGPAENGRDAGARDVDGPSDRYSLTDESERNAPERQTRPAPDAKSQSRGLLREARRALAHNDARRAGELVGQVKRLGLTFSPQEDSPEKVESLLRRTTEVAAGAPNNDQAAHARERAQLLMDQAEGLLRYQDLTAAQELAQQARALPVEYQPFDQTPDRLLGRIEAARRASSRGAVGRDPAEPRGLAEAPGQGRLRRSDAGASSPRKQEVQKLISAASAALEAGDLTAARDLAIRAEEIALPDNQFAEDETRPWQIRKQIEDRVIQRNVGQVSGRPGDPYSLTDDGEPRGNFPVAQGVYRPANDRTRNAQAQATGAGVAPTTTPSGGSAGARLYQEGLRALEQQDRPGALDRFKEAWKHEAELEPAVRRDLMTKLSLLQAAPGVLPPNEQLSPLEEVDAQEQLRRQQLYREILNEQKTAERQAGDDPNGALVRLQKLRDRVREAEVTPGSKKQLLTLVDRSIHDLQDFLEQNKQQIAQDQHNQGVLRGVEDERLKTNELENQLAKMVEDFNTLVDERRYAEAEVIAKKAAQIAPRDPVVVNLVEKSRFMRRIAADAEIRDQKEEGFILAMQEVDRAAIPGDNGDPYQFNQRLWRDLSRDRRRTLERYNLNFSREDAEIQKKLRTKVDVRFNEQPLSDVLHTLGALADVNVHLDPHGLSVEGVAIDTPVTINLREPISLRSALNLILQPLQLSYVVEDEVLRITNEDAQKENVYAKVYNVADLIIPIPNFVPTHTTSLQEAIREGYQAMGYGSAAPPSVTAPLLLAANQKDATTDGSVLAQLGAAGASAVSHSSRPTQLSKYGLGTGGSSQADFDGLIDLITSVIEPSSWDEVGGTGSVQGFDTNLSLVVSQTQEVHDQLADLLDQLRRLQDLQVTIEMRFITLSDNFFERIGVDFNFDIDDNSGFSPAALGLDPTVAGDPRLEDSKPSMVVGINPIAGSRTGTGDGDLRFQQGSFGATIPPFGAFDPGSAANFGFAILSDIEAFFVISAAQGDSRTNVLQAPKVTLFNGQSANVFDFSARPFVTSIIPVVADFAVAQQPVITVLNEGTSLSVQAVVSSDRRFVRLTLVPTFTTIGDVEEFKFTGSDSSDTGTTKTEDRDKDGNVDRATTMANRFLTQQGSVVQLPVFNVTSVQTTVSVPDGGTVLLGGIKRLREGRTERGVPILSKLPYINRLFKNVGIGRETTSLMMMVTPRIIIQEEEEERQTGYTSADQ